VKAKLARVWAKTGGRCWYCGRELVDQQKHRHEYMENWFVADHIEPKARGGTDALSNLTPACWVCNSSKGSKTLEEYRNHVAQRRAGIPDFSEEQVAWLTAHGFRWPELPKVVFWGENHDRQG